MKAWYDDIDTATLQRIKTYSAFNDPESKNLMVQTMYEYRQEEIAELEAQVEKMKCCGNCRFSESDKLNGTFCHREGCFVVASAKCKLWEN